MLCDICIWIYFTPLLDGQLFSLKYYLVEKPILKWASLVAQLVKNLPAMQETRVRSLSQEDAVEKEMATHSNVFSW